MADEYEAEYEGDDEHEDEADADGSCGDERGYRYVLEVPESMTPPPFRLIELKTGQDLDPREIVAVPFLYYARGCASQCPSRACSAAGICQQPPLKCRLRPYAETYDWDHDLPNGPRREMYKEMSRKYWAGSRSGFNFRRR
jgi:hypothetical protein